MPQSRTLTLCLTSATRDACVQRTSPCTSSRNLWFEGCCWLGSVSVGTRPWSWERGSGERGKRRECVCQWRGTAHSCVVPQVRCRGQAKRVKKSRKGEEGNRQGRRGRDGRGEREKESKNAEQRAHVPAAFVTIGTRAHPLAPRRGTCGCWDGYATDPCRMRRVASKRTI